MGDLEALDPRAILEATLELIQVRLANFELRPHHLVPDLLVCGYATDVREHCRATLVLIDSDVPRAAYACARAATEATQDLMLLVSDAEQYDENGAQAYVWELLETEQLQRRFVRGRTDMGIPVPADLGPSVEEVLAVVVEKWGRANPAGEEMLRGALARLRAFKRLPSHWSGLSRREISKRILEGSGHEHITAAMDALYGALSVHTHPRMREWSRKFGFLGPRVTVRENPEDRDRPVELTWAAGHGAWIALELSQNQLYLP